MVVVNSDSSSLSFAVDSCMPMMPGFTWNCKMCEQPVQENSKLIQCFTCANTVYCNQMCKDIYMVAHFFRDSSELECKTVFENMKLSLIQNLWLEINGLFNEKWLINMLCDQLLGTWEERSVIFFDIDQTPVNTSDMLMCYRSIEVAYYY